MDFSQLAKLGMPTPETDREKIERLTTQVQLHISKKYFGDAILDDIEKAIFNVVEKDSFFDCSEDGIGSKIFGKEDHENPILGLHIGVMPDAKTKCLNVFASKMSNVIHENGDKELIFTIMCVIIVGEMKTRLSQSEDYVFMGTVDDKNRGIIRKKDV